MSNHSVRLIAIALLAIWISGCNTAQHPGTPVDTGPSASKESSRSATPPKKLTLAVYQNLNVPVDLPKATQELLRRFETAIYSSGGGSFRNLSEWVLIDIRDGSGNSVQCIGRVSDLATTSSGIISDSLYQIGYCLRTPGVVVNGRLVAEPNYQFGYVGAWFSPHVLVTMGGTGFRVWIGHCVFAENGRSTAISYVDETFTHHTYLSVDLSASERGAMILRWEFYPEDAADPEKLKNHKWPNSPFQRSHLSNIYIVYQSSANPPDIKDHNPNAEVTEGGDWIEAGEKILLERKITFPRWWKPELVKPKAPPAR